MRQATWMWIRLATAAGILIIATTSCAKGKSDSKLDDATRRAAE